MQDHINFLYKYEKRAVSLFSMTELRKLFYNRGAEDNNQQENDRIRLNNRMHREMNHYVAGLLMLVAIRFGIYQMKK